MAPKGVETEIIAREKELLERWSAGDPVGYTAALSEDGTYFDDIGASRRLQGRDAIRAYAASLAGQIPAHDYEMVDPLVQQPASDVAVLTFLYQPSAPDGTPLTPWRATTVYHREGRGWTQIHAHWAIQKS